MKKLLILYGTADHKSYIHYLPKQLGYKQSSVKAPILTGSDNTSKIGTKSGALLCSPEKYILNFEEKDTTPNDLKNAEKNLLKVFNNARKPETFNELGTEQYIEKYVKTSSNLFCNTWTC